MDYFEETDGEHTEVGAWNDQEDLIFELDR